jgi:pimeloyl-ACP methyl ester carboxylesterase
MPQMQEFREVCRTLRNSDASTEAVPAESGQSGHAPHSRVYLLHGKGGSPDGTVKKFQEKLEKRCSSVEFIRLALPHSDPGMPAEASVEFLENMDVPRGSLLIGVSLGGLVAARLQELGRDDLQVIAISSPTWADEVKLECRAARRVAFYSSADNVIAGRVDGWPALASFAHDFPWLSHDTDQHLGSLAALVKAYQRR